MKLQCRNLQITQGAFRLEIDLLVEGKVIGIFGESGAGKTTFLEIVAGLRSSATGLVTI